MSKIAASRFRSQPRIPGTRRRQMSTAVTERIERWIQGEMHRYGVSRSFVIAVACADAGGIKLSEDEHY